MPPGLVPSVPQYPMQGMDVVAQPPAAPVSPVVAVETKEKEKKPARKKKPEPLTVEELLNIPLPPKAKEAQMVEKKEEVVVDTKDDVKAATKKDMSTKQVDETKRTAVAIASPKVKSETHVDRSDVSDIEAKLRHPEKSHRSKVKVEKVEEKAQLKDAQKDEVDHRRTGSDRSPDISKTSMESTNLISGTSDVKTESIESDVSVKREMPSEALVDSTATRKIDAATVIDGEEPKVYHFVWDDVDPGCVSGVSSVHTSDLSSFDDGSDAAAWSSIDDVALKAREEVTVIETKPRVKPDAGTFNVTSAKYRLLNYTIQYWLFPILYAIQYNIGYFQCRPQLTL